MTLDPATKTNPFKVNEASPPLDKAPPTTMGNNVNVVKKLVGSSFNKNLAKNTENKGSALRNVSAKLTLTATYPKFTNTKPNVYTADNLKNKILVGPEAGIGGGAAEVKVKYSLSSAIADRNCDRQRHNGNGAKLNKSFFADVLHTAEAVYQTKT
jgi:hypothetical protein